MTIPFVIAKRPPSFSFSAIDVLFCGYYVGAKVWEVSYDFQLFVVEEYLWRWYIQCKDFCFARIEEQSYFSSRRCYLFQLGLSIISIVG